MEIVVVTGLIRNKDAMAVYCSKLAKDGFKPLNNHADHDAHPRDITRAVENEILVLHKIRPSWKCYVKTNSDHYINALRVLRFNGKIDVLKIKHFGLEGKVYDIEVDADGEPSEYPECFLDEWPNMVAQLWSGEKKEGVAK